MEKPRAVLGVIGPDSHDRRILVRHWGSKIAPTVLVRFAVSVRDRSARPWWQGVAKASEPDIDFLDCLSQSMGQAVVILSLFDAWLRHAIVRYPDVDFIGRADDDTVPSPGWLLSVVHEQSARLAEMPGRALYAGSVQWYNWDERHFRPLGWGAGPRGSRRSAVRENPRNCALDVSTPMCSGPFPFTTGPLLLMSASLTRWYVNSSTVSAAITQAFTARLNRTAGAPDVEYGVGKPLSLERARKRGLFLRPTDAGDLDVRLFDDVFLGHALCVGGAPNVSILEFPPGLYADVPCGGGQSGCRNGLRRFNFSSPGAPLLLHHVRNAALIPIALEAVEFAPFLPQTAVHCTNYKSVSRGTPQPCGPGWQWCKTPFADPRQARRSIAIKVRAAS